MYISELVVYNSILKLNQAKKKALKSHINVELLWQT